MTDEILQRTKLAFDEIHELAQAKITLSDFESLLINSYNLGAKNASEMLGLPVEIDLDDMEEAFFVLIDGKTYEDRYREYADRDDNYPMQRLIESECHRVYNRGADNSAKRGGRTVVKSWNTMLDDRVRQTHDYLEGTRVPIESDFYTFDGDHAPYPGAFGKAENNVNCRCIVDYSYK